MIRSLLVVALLAGVAHADDPTYACHVADPATTITATFRPEVSLSDLGVWVTGFSCMNVVFSADVAKRATKVHIIASKPMTPKQAIQLFVDAVEATGLVVTQKPDTIIIKPGPKMPQSCPDIASAAVPAAPPVPPSPDPSDELAKLMDKDIVVIDDTHRTLTRALVDKILANPMAVAKGARIVPAVSNGKPAGFKLYAIRPSSFYARIGLANGDTLTMINGFEMTSADKALEVYTKLRDATSIELDLIRRGKPVKLFITIK